MDDAPDARAVAVPRVGRFTPDLGRACPQDAAAEVRHCGPVRTWGCHPPARDRAAASATAG